MAYKICSCFFFILITITVFIANLFLNDITLYPFFYGISFVFLFFTVQNSKIINSKIIQTIGQLSFSMYISHFIFAWGVGAFLNNLLKGYIPAIIILIIAYVVAVLLSIAFSLITKNLIETKGIKLGSKLISKIKFHDKN